MWGELRLGAQYLCRMIARAHHWQLTEGVGTMCSFSCKEVMVTLILGGTVNVGGEDVSLPNWLWTTCRMDMDMEDSDSDGSEDDSPGSDNSGAWPASQRGS